MATSSHVLLLNASPDESDMYALWLEACGYRVTVARSLASARHMARREAIDVLVIDALFSPWSGRAEFERRWSRLTNHASLPIVVLSGFLVDAHPLAQLGTRQVCVFKPCLPQQLSSRIQDLLSTPSHPPGVAGTGNHLGGCSPS